ncbi:nuclease-related domain-containing protein [Exiguobacterium antarcticum]|uniref:Nuclease-related domain-containing protein n=1 Tax=Exiguobacterium antarcticum TaxID=132920 RepID=A0ABT6R0C5_9BACL|nr:nuclease-related domain-containing protein [Exiguobacterium antarcticum]MDI3234252.1 nuclease-related domain-containing protein [Exiguobacterium antarcticum]
MEDLLTALIPALLLIGSVLIVGFIVTLGSLFYFRRRSFEKSTYKQVTQECFLKAVRDKGIWGEYLTTRQLEKVEGYGKFVMNTYLPKARGKGLTEIDITFIHESGIYVLESKNYSGWIFGKEADRQWTQMFKNRYKQRFYNPIKQNEQHLKSMEQFLAKTVEDNVFQSVIVFSERCELKKITIDSSHVHVIKRNDLRRTIKRLATVKRLTSMQVDSVYEQLKQQSQVDQQVKDAHIEAIKSFSS